MIAIKLNTNTIESSLMTNMRYRIHDLRSSLAFLKMRCNYSDGIIDPKKTVGVFKINITP